MATDIGSRDLVQLVISGVCTFLLIALLFFHCIRSIKAFNDINSELVWKWHSVLFYSFVLILIALIHCSFAVFEEIYALMYGHINMALCNTITTVFVTNYGVFKLVMYYALISRLTESFKNASAYYTCSNRFYLFWAIFLTITTIPFIIISRILITVDKDLIKLGKCRVTIPIENTILIIIFDIFVSIVNLYLFIIPLKTLSKECDKKDSVSKIYHILIKKNAILATITILTSVFVWIVIGLLKDILHIPVAWQSVDCLISAISIVLLFKWNQYLYDLLCCGGGRNKSSETMEMINVQSKTHKVVITPTFSMESPKIIPMKYNVSKTDTEVP